MGYRSIPRSVTRVIGGLVYFETVYDFIHSNQYEPEVDTWGYSVKTKPTINNRMKDLLGNLFLGIELNYKPNHTTNGPEIKGKKGKVQRWRKTQKNQSSL